MPNSNYSNQVPKYQRRVKQRQIAVNKEKPRDIAHGLQHRAKITNLRYAEPKPSKRRGPLPPSGWRDTASAKRYLLLFSLEFIFALSAAVNAPLVPVIPASGPQPRSRARRMNNAFETDDGRATSVSAVEPGMPQALQPSLPESSWEQFLKRVARSADSHDNHHHTRRRGDAHEALDKHHDRRRGDDHQRHHPHSHNADGDSLQPHLRNSTVYPHRLSGIMTDLIESSSFESIIAPELRRHGYEPDELLEVNVYPLDLHMEEVPQGETVKESWTAIEVVEYFSTARLTWRVRGASKRAKKLIKTIKEQGNFPQRALRRHKDKYIKLADDAIDNKAIELNIYEQDGNHPHDQKGTFKYIVANVPERYTFGAAHSHPKGDLAIIYETHTYGRFRRFLVSLHSPELIHELPTENKEFQTWMGVKGKNIAFKNPSTLPRGVTFSTIKFDDKKHWFTNGVEEFLTIPSINKTTESFSQLIGRETLLEEAAYLLLGLAIPGWDAFNALRKGDFGHALIFLSLEFIPMMGTSGKLMLKIAFKGSKFGSKFVKTAAFIERKAPGVFENAKTAYGAHETLIDLTRDSNP